MNPFAMPLVLSALALMATGDRSDELILWLYAESCGGRPDQLVVPEGAKALADWLTSNRDHVERLNHVLVDHGRSIERVLTGELMPSDALMLALAQLTDGAVDPLSFERAVTVRRPKIPASTTVDAGAAAGGVSPLRSPAAIFNIDPADVTWFSPERGTESAEIKPRSVIGERGFGPLWKVQAPAGPGQPVTIAGGGLMMALDVDHATALWRDLGKALLIEKEQRTSLATA